MSMSEQDVVAALRHVTDLVRQEPDPVVRAELLGTLARAYEHEAVTIRDATAYQLRTDLWTVDEIGDMFGVNRHTVVRWTSAHARRAGVKDIKQVRNRGPLGIAVRYVAPRNEPRG